MIFSQLNPPARLSHRIAAEEPDEAAIVEPFLEHSRDEAHPLVQVNLLLTHVIWARSDAGHVFAATAVEDRTDCEYIMHLNPPAHDVTHRLMDGGERHLADVKREIGCRR